MWCLETVPRLEAASREIFTALVLVLDLDFSALALVLRVGALALSQDRDQDTNVLLCSVSIHTTLYGFYVLLLIVSINLG